MDAKIHLFVLVRHTLKCPVLHKTVFGLLGFLVGSIGIVLAIVDFLLKVRSP